MPLWFLGEMTVVLRPIRTNLTISVLMPSSATPKHKNLLRSHSNASKWTLPILQRHLTPPFSIWEGRKKEIIFLFNTFLDIYCIFCLKLLQNNVSGIKGKFESKLKYPLQKKKKKKKKSKKNHVLRQTLNRIFYLSDNFPMSYVNLL